MKHRLSNGKRWRIERKKLLGLCDYESKTITISPGLRRMELVDTVIHEVMHAELPKLRHRKVERVSTSCARAVVKVLKREGLF